MVAGCVRGIASPDDVDVRFRDHRCHRARPLHRRRIRAAHVSRAAAVANNAGIYATVNQPESMQLVMDNAGSLKVLYASAAAAAGRVIGRHGDFYRILGSAVAEIDGYTGTMPPYERHIVFGPENPDDAAAAIAQACGAHATIVDVNDLGIRLRSSAPVTASNSLRSPPVCAKTRTATAISRRRSWC